MSENIEKWKCGRCAMAFVLGKAPQERTEKSRCAECKMLYWCVARQFPIRVAVCGIEHGELA